MPEEDKKCCGNCAACESPFKLQSMVCAAQLSLYNMKILESMLPILEEINQNLKALTQGSAMTPEKPHKKRKAQGEGGAENSPSK